MSGVARTQRNSPARLKRAEHARLWRAVEGAVLDAFNSHPDYLTDGGRAAAVESVTKRVVGAILHQSATGGCVCTSRSVQRWTRCAEGASAADARAPVPSGAAGVVVAAPKGGCAVMGRAPSRILDLLSPVSAGGLSGGAVSWARRHLRGTGPAPAPAFSVSRIAGGGAGGVRGGPFAAVPSSLLDLRARGTGGALPAPARVFSEVREMVKRVLDPGRAADLQRLEMLHLRDHEGMKDSAIARLMGVTPATVRGAFRSIEAAEREARRAARAAGTGHLDANGDGTMPARLWAAEVVA